MKRQEFLPKRVLIAGGGTGGHVYPALATIAALRELGNFEFLYVGGRDGIETRIVPRYNIAMETLWISGFARGLRLKNLLFPVKLLASLWKSRRIIKRFQPHVAVGAGGYVSGPVLYMAAKMKVPVLIEEQDVYPGVTTRLLARYARKICLSFEGTRKHLEKYAGKIVVTGNPVRKELTAMDRRQALAHWGFDPGRLTLFIFGGSQGARSINQAMIKLLPELSRKYPLQVLWQTGESQYETVMKQVESHNTTVKVMAFVQEMGAAYTAADVVVCRAGALTLAELALTAKPAILIPYPHAAANHQEHNSRLMEEAGAALMVREGEGWEQELKIKLQTILDDPELRQKQARAWQRLARPDAAEKISREILELIG